MSRKRHKGRAGAGTAASATSATSASSTPGAAAAAPAVAPGAVATTLPLEVAGPDWTAPLLGLMLFLTPTLGVPNETLIQDTLKSMVVSGMALLALLAFFWHQRQRSTPLRWHAALALPAALLLYALGSMVWSHTFLAAVEAIRWAIFSVLMWLVLNSISRERFAWVAWGIHAGAAGAALWTALQFWFDFKGFPQGPNPASTFVNRNFMAEFVVCTLPFSAWLLMRMRGALRLGLMGASTAFNLVAILMAGTRSALLGVAVLIPVLVLVVRRYGAALPLGRWSPLERRSALGALLATVLVLGVIPSQNAALHTEHRALGVGLTPITRSVLRVQSMADPLEYRERSIGIRWIMWRTTGRMIAAHPLAGVGAGAWEVHAPLYGDAGSQLETDYYVHNEYLQLLAEYGLVGLAFLVALFAWLLQSAVRTWRNLGDDQADENQLRALVLAGVLMLLIVSNAGFPWRMASTGAMFAVGLGLLAASDARLARARSRSNANNAGTNTALPVPHWLLGALPWRPWAARTGMALTGLALLLAAYISQQAVRAEHHIVMAVKTALTVTQSGQYHHPRWDEPKRQMLDDIRAGVAITPHYRKLTPMVADEMAKWNEWKDAVWIWESVLQSRPYVVAIMANIGRGYSVLGQTEKAREYLRRCQALQPRAPAVRSLEVIILGKEGRQAEALAATRKTLDEGIFDYDLVNAAYILGKANKDWNLALRALELRLKHWPAKATESWLLMGRMHADPKNPKFDETLALTAFRQAVRASNQDPVVRGEVPEPYRSLLGE